ncbi:MAG: DUF2147 domain-containing protein [Pseudomonadota bacterium]
MRAIVGLVVLLMSLPAAAARDSLFGLWKTVDDQTKEIGSVVEIYEKEGKLFGKIIKLFPKEGEDPNPVCVKCDDHRKDQPIIGLNIIEGLSKDGDEWEGGTVLSPGEGKVYKCKIWLEDGKLKLRGYVGFIYRTQTWEPYEEDEAVESASADSAE